MKDFACVGRRLRRYKFLAFILLAIAGVILAGGVADFMDHGPPMDSKYDIGTGQWVDVMLSPSSPAYQTTMRRRWSELMFFAFWAGGFATLGLLARAASRKPPAKETLHLAQARHGLLTLPEISTAFDIDPHLAAKALAQLQKLKIAIPRWQEFRRNIWEFPDYMDLAIAQMPEAAQDGPAPAEDRAASYPNRDAVRQALNTVSVDLAPASSGGSSQMAATPQ